MNTRVVPVLNFAVFAPPIQQQRANLSASMTEPYAADVCVDIRQGGRLARSLDDSRRGWQDEGKGPQKDEPSVLETATALVRESHEAWHQEMAALVRDALAVAQTAGQTAGKVAPVTAPPSAEAAADRMEAAANRMEAALETASALRLTDMLQVATDTPAPSRALPSPPLVAASSPFGTTPAAAAAASSTGGHARGKACGYCHEPGPFFAGTFGGLVCGVHHAMTLSLLHDPSTKISSGYGEATGSLGERAHADAKSGSECTLECGNMVTNSTSGSRCASGHVLCADCTSQYVDKTLLPQGTVWWDTIDCVATGCAEHMLGMSVQRCISRAVVARVDASQLKVVPMIGPEARRERERAAEAARLEGDNASREAVAKFTWPCPQCHVDTEKTGGCSNMVCLVCGKRYKWY